MSECDACSLLVKLHRVSSRQFGYPSLLDKQHTKSACLRGSLETKETHVSGWVFVDDNSPLIIVAKTSGEVTSGSCWPSNIELSSASSFNRTKTTLKSLAISRILRIS